MKINSELKSPTKNDASKKLYKKPRLTKYGKVKNLTLGDGSRNYDEGSLVMDLE